jgi:hypothetical protein
MHNIASSVPAIPGRSLRSRWVGTAGVVGGAPLDEADLFEAYLMGYATSDPRERAPQTGALSFLQSSKTPVS